MNKRMRIDMEEDLEDHIIEDDTSEEGEAEDGAKAKHKVEEVERLEAAPSRPV
jgi:hypothetical protein